MAYSHEDGRLVAKPTRGPNAGKEFEFASFKDLEFDPGTKRKVVTGRRQAPIYTATSGAEPKLTPTFTSSEEYMRWWQFLHGAGQAPTRNAQVTVSFTLTRPGVPTHSWRFLRCQFPSPGFKSGDNGVEAGKTEITLEDAHLDGATIYEQ
jgi:hypothetical protein